MKIMNEVYEMMHRLEEQRDELRLKMHLAEMDCRDEWQDVQTRFERLKASVHEASEEVKDRTEDTWKGLKVLGDEVADAFRCLRKDL